MASSSEKNTFSQAALIHKYIIYVYLIFYFPSGLNHVTKPYNRFLFSLTVWNDQVQFHVVDLTV